MGLTRRNLFRHVALAAGAMHFGCAQGDNGVPVAISIPENAKPGPRVPDHFTGLSYESSQLANPRFFAPDNKDLVRLVKRLGTRGVLRLGGNTSEFTRWSPGGLPPGYASPLTAAPDVGGKNRQRPVALIIPDAVRNLAAFVDEIGWQLIYGLNLGKGSPEMAAAEAKAVYEVSHKDLFAFQIGNEADLYHRNGLRPENYGYAQFLTEWKQYTAAVRKQTPSAPFAGPDVANATDWIVPFAKDSKGEIVELTGHYYAEGPPSNPAMTLSRLLRPDPKLLHDIPINLAAAEGAGVPFRMSEGNSCYSGGKEGVSNTFGAALWAADFMLLLAQSGYAGVNLHGGGNGWYTPIAGDPDHGFTARPVYYGMLLAQQFAGAAMLKVQVSAADANVTAYAARKPEHLMLAIFNKDETKTVRAHIAPDGQYINENHSWGVWRLTAPSLESTSGVTLAGSQVGPDGSWSSRNEELAASRDVELKPGSAVLMFSR